MRYLFIILSLSIVTKTNSQVWDNVPVHKVKGRSPDCWYQTSASIDSVLWNDYIDFVLMPDSVQKKSIAQGVYKIPVMFVVDAAGQISLVKANSNPYQLGKLIEERLIKFPYKWSPATQNGRPVKSYHRIILEFDLRRKKP